MKDEIFLRDPEYDEMPEQKLMEFFHYDSITSRARSIAVLARRATHNDKLTDQVMALISSSPNMLARIMGTISVSHIGYACLWEFGSPLARIQLLILLQDWPEPDRTDLLWYLKSQDIEVKEEK